MDRNFTNEWTTNVEICIVSFFRITQGSINRCYQEYRKPPEEFAFKARTQNACESHRHK
jgi:hypothetical protein